MAKTKLETDLFRELGVSTGGSVTKWTYDEWLNYFRKVPAAKLMQAKGFLQFNIPSEGFAAAARWIEIYGSPSKIDKLHQSKLKGERITGLKELAKSDDQEKFYEALIDENVEKLESGEATAQEVARLTANINIFNKALREIRSRKPKAGSVLEKTMKLASRKEKPPEKPKKAVKPLKKKQAKKKEENAESKK